MTPKIDSITYSYFTLKTLQSEEYPYGQVSSGLSCRTSGPSEVRVLSTIPADYLAVGLMAIVGFLFPFGGFLTSYFLRPTQDPNDPTKMRSILIPGMESDQSLYVRRLSTYECGADPVGDARIEFHFQYYWYAIIFLVFDIAFMFLSFAGILVTEATAQGGSQVVSLEEVWGGLLTLAAIFGFMVLGVWYVFRKRGRIYI